LAYWRPLRYQTKRVMQTLGDGINTAVPPFDIEDGENTYHRELDSRDYPALSVRPGRSTYGTAGTTSPFGLGKREDSYLHAIDNNTWRYWNSATTAWVNITTGLSSTEGRIEEYADGTNRYTILMNSSQKKIWDGTSTALNFGDTNTPDTKYFCVHKQRVYAIDNDNGLSIGFSALDLPNDWTTADDSGSIRITNAAGNGTAIVTYGDHVICFTEHSMHELYGTGPDNYELIDVGGAVGCISDRSVVACQGKLYWAAYDGFYQYAGGLPRKVSDAVNAYWDDINFTYRAKIASGSVEEYIYVAIPYGSAATANNLILKYDTRLGKWYIETGNFVDFVRIGNVLYGVDKDGAYWNMRDEDATADSTTPISWSWISKPFHENAVEGKKTLSEMWLVVDRSTGSTSFSIGFSTNVHNNDSTSFTTITSTVGASSNIQNVRHLIPSSDLQDVNWYRLRLAGTGQTKVHYLQKNFRVKPR